MGLRGCAHTVSGRRKRFGVYSAGSWKSWTAPCTASPDVGSGLVPKSNTQCWARNCLLSKARPFWQACAITWLFWAQMYRVRSRQLSAHECGILEIPMSGCLHCLNRLPQGSAAVAGVSGAGSAAAARAPAPGVCGPGCADRIGRALGALFRPARGSLRRCRVQLQQRRPRLSRSPSFSSA